jgi:hypothetical protein
LAFNHVQGENMSEENKKSLVPHFVIGAIVIVVLAIMFWPSEPKPEAEPPVVADTMVSVPEPDSSVPEAEITVDDSAESASNEDEVTQLEPVAPPMPLDTSDGAVKSKLMNLSSYDAFARLIIDDALLQRFVVTTNTLAEQQLSTNNRVLVKPENPFRTFVQADKQWIDPASYKRYTPYVEALESMDTAALLNLYAEYKPALQDIFAEISGPSDEFNDKLITAIDVLLDTPEVPTPVEVYTDSVMFKFADPQLEGLAAAQKQLLRTGPDNMRRIKAKLREIKEAL